MLPNPGNRIVLSDQKDEFGIPLAWVFVPTMKNATAQVHDKSAGDPNCFPPLVGLPARTACTGTATPCSTDWTIRRATRGDILIADPGVRRQQDLPPLELPRRVLAPARKALQARCARTGSTRHDNVH